MKSAKFRMLAILVPLFGIWGSHLMGHEEDVANEMAIAASRLVTALDVKQLGLVRIQFNDSERENFHFIPRERKGLPLSEMRTDQQVLALALLSSGLSHLGYGKVATIMSLERILYENASERTRAMRNPELYFFSIFGDPTPGETWGWRFEGHHVSVNFSIVDGHHISATPSFLGSNPATVKTGSRSGLQVLADEENLGREFARSLSEKQRKVAFFSDQAPRDIITAADREITPLEPRGIGWADLTADQQVLLRTLVNTYLNRHRAEVADADRARIEQAGWKEIHFASAGSPKPGQGHYYRIQGPTFLLEYDNVQNGANHVHSVYRDFAEDFGRDLLKEHYQQDHKP